eukprot:scaffold178084_cov44-Attheya_sp.AAC.1
MNHAMCRAPGGGGGNLQYCPRGGTAVTQIFSDALIVVGVPTEEVLSLFDRFDISSNIVQGKCISQDGAKV